MIFYFKHRVVDKVTGKEAIVTSGFEIERVRKVTQSVDGGLIVILDDGHEESRYYFKKDKKTGKALKNAQGEEIFDREARVWIETDLELNVEDSKRFILASSIDNPDFPLYYTKEEKPPISNFEISVAQDEPQSEVGALAD